MKNILFFTFIIILFSSCEDFFSTTLKVDPPPHEDQLVTSAFFTNADTNLQVLVNRSTAILENIDQNTRNIDGATVRLFSGEELLTTIPFNSNPNQTIFNHIERGTSVIFESGQEYTLKVDHPDYEEASATVVVPNEVIPFRFDLEEDAGIDEYGDRSDRVTVEFNDPSEEENFYEMALFTIRDFGNGDVSFENHYISTLDLNLNDSFNGASVISDETFNGQTYKLQLDINRYENNVGEFQTFLIWRSVTKDYYQYSQSVRLQREAEDFGPFSEPVSIRSNFENGLGLFSINFEKVYPL